MIIVRLPPKTEKTVPEQTKPPKAGKTHAAPEEKAAPPAPEVPPTPRDATRAEKEEIVYLDLSDLHPFKDHPFGVRDDAEMKSLVESVRNGGVNQPALVRPREGGGYEIIAGHRRQMASQLAGYRNMPCIVRNMTDDEAILAMTDDNLRQRETILPSEKAMKDIAARELKGHNILAVERFWDSTFWMIEFTVLRPTAYGEPGDEMRLFLTEDGYQSALQSQQRREIKIKRYAHVIEGHILDFKPKKHRRS